MKALLPTAVLAVLALLAGCGGGSAPPPPTQTPPPAPADPTPPAVPPPPPERDMVYYMNRCVAKPGSKPGTLQDEQHFLRLWIDATYLWYREVPAVDMNAYSTPGEYFDVLKTPLLTPTGKPKDRYHFRYTDARWSEIASGQQQGYGISWVRRGDGVPRDWRVAGVEAGSPAAAADLRRGDRLLAVDGIDFINATGNLVDGLNAGLTPAPGTTHRLTMERAGAPFDVALTPARVTAAPVQNTRVIDTPEGRIGYLTFNSHIAAAEAPLAAAMTTLRDAGVTDLVLDLRYNGGGLLSVASQLSYMIAGPQATAGKTFELTVPNDKTKVDPPVPFYATTRLGDALPALNLKRVFMLTGPGTCSASESIINSLRGIDIDVHLIGGTTCGKPYAFLPTSNCGNTYFAIQYQGYNAKGFGDYGDGFAPTCAAADDMGHPLGDSAETLLATALRYRAAGTCPAPAAAARSAAAAPAFMPVRPEGAEITVHDVR